MLMVAHMGEGGVKNCRKYAHVVYGRPLCICSLLMLIFFRVAPQQLEIGHTTVRDFEHYIYL